MLPNKVDQMLRSYRECLGKCKSLERQITEQKRLIQSIRATMLVDASMPGIQNMDGMPRGTQIGRPTERIALLYADGYEPDEIREMEAELHEMEIEYRQKSTTVIFVDAWLSELTEVERYVIEHHVIDGETWSELIPNFRNKYGELQTKYGLRRVKAMAMEKIYRIAE